MMSFRLFKLEHRLRHSRVCGSISNVHRFESIKHLHDWYDDTVSSYNEVSFCWFRTRVALKHAMSRGQPQGVVNRAGWGSKWSFSDFLQIASIDSPKNQLNGRFRFRDPKICSALSINRSFVSKQIAIYILIIYCHNPLQCRLMTPSPIQRPTLLCQQTSRKAMMINTNFSLNKSSRHCNYFLPDLFIFPSLSIVIGMLTPFKLLLVSAL